MENKQFIEFSKHTIIVTIGITNCGKSTLCNDHLIPYLESIGLTYKYLNGDKIRREILFDDTLNKHDQKMVHVSKQAFDVLENQLDNFTQYPVNTDVIIVDVMNLNKENRQFIVDIAKKNHYQLIGLLFDFKDRNDYFKYSDKAKVSAFRINEALKTFKEETLKTIDKKEFSKVYKITSNDYSDITFSFKDISIKQPFIELYNQYCIVADIHGCLDEFQACIIDGKNLKIQNGQISFISLDEREIKQKYYHHILVGDYLDKGPKIKETIEFIYDNINWFYIVKGNHEVWVYKFLKGELGSYEKHKEMIDGFFDSIHILQNDEELRNKFFFIYENCSYEFIELPNAIITHAPCMNKYLGKSDNVSLRNQRTYMYPKRADFVNEEDFLIEREKVFHFLINDAENCLPLHIFGHVPSSSVLSMKNKYGIDTGCVMGGSLTSILLKKDQRRPFIKKYKSLQPISKEPLYNFFRLKEYQVLLSKLEWKEQARLKYAALNKLNFISGTMSPCDKNTSIGELESLEKGIEYYKNNNVEKIILQPKFMGSRCNIKLHKSDIEKCLAFSRQGYEIKQERLKQGSDLIKLFRQLQNKYSNLFKKYKAEYILFDGELLPWNAMGEDLINKEFKLPAIALGSELNFLQNNGFNVEVLNFEKKLQNFDLKEHEVKQKTSYNNFKEELQSLSVQFEDLFNYNKQLSIFSGDAPLEYKAFSILKVFYTDGTEESFVNSSKSNLDIFSEISESPYLVLSLKSNSGVLYLNEDKEYGFDNIEKALSLFWSIITKDKEMEGVVIKPETVYIPNVAPYLKCRNKEYLRLTYGMDYLSLESKKIKLLKNKSIKRKIETSIKEWELGKNLLEIDSKDISLQNDKWLSYTYQLMVEQDNEKQLDPRL